MVAGLHVVQAHAVHQHQHLPEPGAPDGEVGLHAPLASRANIH